MNTLTTELMHHGVDGMHWYVRRYQPYQKGDDAAKKGTFIGEGTFSSTSFKPKSGTNTVTTSAVQKMFGDGRRAEAYGLFRQHYEPAKKAYSDAYEDMYRRTEKSTAAGGYGISTRASEVLGNWLGSYDVSNTITDKIRNCLDANTGKLRSDSIQTGMSLLGEYAVNYNRAHGMRAGWEDQGMSSNRGSVEKWAGFLGDQNAKRHAYW